MKLSPGSDAVQVPAEIGVDPATSCSPRYHGLGPMTGTQLDPILRNLGVTTIVGVGVSLNVGMTNLAFDAVNRGYQMVHAARRGGRRAVGVRRRRCSTTRSNVVATLTTTAEVVNAWGQ